MTVRGMRLRVHPLTPLMLALIYVLSGGQALIPSLIALGAHESAHLLLALRLHARVDEIELMPFGAAIRLYELWETSPGALVAIALAGPGMNLAAASLLALGLYAFPAEALALIPLIRMNLAIGAVNLLPALPLDGGRALCALMALRMDRHRAVRIGVILGRVLAAGILLFTGFLCLSRRAPAAGARAFGRLHHRLRRTRTAAVGGRDAARHASEAGHARNARAPCAGSLSPKPRPCWTPCAKCAPAIRTCSP